MFPRVEWFISFLPRDAYAIYALVSREWYQAYQHRTTTVEHMVDTQALFDYGRGLQMSHIVACYMIVKSGNLDMAKKHCSGIYTFNIKEVALSNGHYDLFLWAVGATCHGNSHDDYCRWAERYGDLAFMKAIARTRYAIYERPSDRTMIDLCRMGHFKLIKAIVSTTQDYTISPAAIGEAFARGHFDIGRLLMSLESQIYADMPTMALLKAYYQSNDKAHRVAADHITLELLQQFDSVYLHDLRRKILRAAVYNGNVEVIEFMDNKGFILRNVDIRHMMEQLHMKGSRLVMRWLLKNRYHHLEDALGHTDLMPRLEEFKQSTRRWWNLPGSWWSFLD